MKTLKTLSFAALLIAVSIMGIKSIAEETHEEEQQSERRAKEHKEAIFAAAIEEFKRYMGKAE